MDNNTKLIVIAIVAALVGVGAGYGIGAVMSSGDDTTDYHFYLYFGEGEDNNGWYSGAASDAAKGFDKAMKNADFKYDIGGGYLSTVDDTGVMWSAYSYTYTDTSEDAVEASIGNIITEDYEGYSSFICSDGWLLFNGFGGYEDDDFKVKQSASTIFFFSVYDAEWNAPSPIDVNDWKNGGPFKA